jgi:hypothetical protein
MNPTSDGKLGWQFNESVSINIHIAAPATISLSYNYASASAGGLFPSLLKFPET